MNSQSEHLREQSKVEKVREGILVMVMVAGSREQPALQPNGDSD